MNFKLLPLNLVTKFSFFMISYASCLSSGSRASLNLSLLLCIRCNQVSCRSFTMEIVETQREAKKHYIMPMFAFSCFKGTFRGNNPQIISIQVITTIIFYLSMTFIVIVLATFVNDHIRKFMVSDEYYFLPQHADFPCSVSPAPIISSTMSSFEHSSNGGRFGDYIAPKQLWHSMSDEELMWRASMVPRVLDYPFNRTPKVAFMFLTRGRLPLAPLWEMFFKGHGGLFSIYIHTSLEFKDDERPQSSVFHNRRIPSKSVEWGKATIVDAEKRLLANALLDFTNERFILVSESCIPLFNFSTTYNYLINSNHSHIGSFDEPSHIGRGRYNKRMSPTISLLDWRKGSQWFEVERGLAIEIVSDITYYPILKQHCHPPCYMDEHYLATLARKLAKDYSNSNTTITWVDWSKPGSHPTTFMSRDVSKEFIVRVRRDTSCANNDTTQLTICFLFARKFNPGTLQPLLAIAPSLLGFNS